VATFAEVSEIVDSKLSDRRVWDALMDDEEGVTLAVGLLDDRIQNVGRQLAAADERADPEWERKARNFRSLCQRRLVTARAAVKALSIRNNARAQAWESAARQLAVAIARHSRDFDASMEPESYDTNLWATLNRLTLPGPPGDPADSFTPRDYFDQGTWAV
jgi:hypothetical protein